MLAAGSEGQHGWAQPEGLGSAPLLAAAPPFPEPLLLTAINKLFAVAAACGVSLGWGAAGSPPSLPAGGGGGASPSCTCLVVVGCRLCSCEWGSPCAPPYTHSQRPGLAAAARTRHENFIHIKIQNYISLEISLLLK